MTNTNIMIHNLICLVNKNEGSSLSLPAYGRDAAPQRAAALVGQKDESQILVPQPGLEPGTN